MNINKGIFKCQIKFNIVTIYNLKIIILLLSHLPSILCPWSVYSPELCKRYAELTHYYYEPGPGTLLSSPKGGLFIMEKRFASIFFTFELKYTPVLFKFTLFSPLSIF